MDTLKTFAAQVNTSSVNQRVQITADILPVLAKPDLPEPALKGVVKCLTFTLSRYHDARSRRAVTDVVRVLAVNHAALVIKILPAALKDILVYVKIPVANSSAAKVALQALAWTCVVVKIAVNEAKIPWSELKDLLLAQAALVDGICTSHRDVIITSGFKKMTSVFREVPGSVYEYCSVLSGDPQVGNVCLAAFCMRYFKNKDDHEKYRDKFLDLYVKSVLMSKTKPRVHILQQSQHLLRLATHEDFQNTLLPTLNKMMLRNPENIIECVGFLLRHVNIDLSQYSSDVIKPLGSQLHANSEDVQKEALVAVESLAKQISDVGAAEKVLKHVFQVLNGSEGKLTVINQKQAVLSAVGKMAACQLANKTAAQDLASTVAESLSTYLNSEGHEGTLVHALDNLSVWCAKFSTSVPAKLIQQFKTGPAQKSSTTAVRQMYFYCMTVAFSGDTLIDCKELMPILLAVLEKAQANPTQLGLIAEAAMVSLLLARLSVVDVDSESKLAGLWSFVLDSKKMLLLSDKFVSSAPEKALTALISLGECLVLNHPDRLDKSGVANHWYRFMCLCLPNSNYKVRKHANSSMRKILSTLCGSKLALLFLEQFSALLSDNKFEVHTVSESGDHSGYSAKNLCQALMTLCCIKHLEKKDSYSIAFTSLILAHDPNLLVHDQDLWCSILAKIGLDAGNFVQLNVDKLFSVLTEEAMPSDSCLGAIETIVRIGNHEIIEKLVSFSVQIMKNGALKTVTLDEFHIMKTPEGELFDKSVVQTSQTVDDLHNMKRESKLYSYADQLDEIKWRREREARKLAKGEIIQPKLTKKQQEQKDAQLKKESEIRNRLLELDTKLNASCRIISAMFRGNPVGASREILTLMRTITPIFRSPLAAPRITDLVVQFAGAIFPESRDLGKLVVYSTMRSLSACCELNEWWCQEPATEQMLRAVKLFHDYSKKTEDLDTAKFTLAFYLLRFNLTSKSTDKDIPHNLLAIDTISLYAQIKATDERSGAHLLPRLELLELLLGVVGTRTGKVLQQAFSALMLVAHAGSGEEGFAEAEQNEIDVCFKTMLSPTMSVREACLRSLRKMIQVLPLPDDSPDDGGRLRQRLYVAKFDTEESVTALAEKLWNELCLEIEECLGPALIEDCVHHEECIRKAVSDALGNLLETYPELVSILIPLITEKYEDKLYVPPPVLDNFGRVISEAPPDEWPARSGLAMALGKLSPALTGDQIEDLFNFFVTRGLMDRDENVRKSMLDAALVIITEHGKAHVSKLLPVFEQFLVDAPSTASYDAVRQSVVILMGSLAKHLDKEDPKVKPIIGKLVETLGTPSQQVQEAVANCLPPLVPAISQEAPIYVQKMLQLLLESDRYAERKGAAYGVAGIVKGLGILSLKKHGIMATLQEAIQDKKNPKRREGALFAYEMLCQMLGRLFEPYVVHILPHLLLCFGDNNQYVREAADDTAKAVMSKLSAHGVKLVLPSLLLGLEEDSWRTKTGSVELLGAMAFCAPKQLSACLPSIVPKLTEVLNDSHAKVQKAGSQALRQIGSVIKNPEIQEIVHVLLDALQEPTKQTTPCLQTLLETKFVHFIDAPSLALIMPVVQRAFQDRSTETRKMAAQIIGNIYSLTDQKDLAPYLPSIIPGLKQSLLDPVPEVRSVSSRALGAMVKGMGETSFEELLPWLMKTLTTEGSSVDRSGAAQGLAEVMGAMGIEKLQKLMPDIIETAERMDIPPHVRDGYIMMYIYLPAVFSTEFMPWVGPILPSILKALADESEYVRDTALKAGQRIINMFAETAITLLLPELERGLFDDNWRIRYSSVQLLGDLLYRLSGVTGKMTTESRDDDDNFGTESSQSAIMETLGSDRRNRVLAGLYMGRSDTSLMVRQASLHVWKVIVPNTPRTLRELLPTLFQLLLGCLASTSYDKRQVAAKTLGDIVRKLGERVLPEIIPILESGLESEHSDQRQGVCIGLSEIMSSTNRDHVMVFADSLIPTVRKALIDPLPQVRQAAAQTFDNLHSNIGIRAMEEILPYLLQKLDSEDTEVSERALDGLQQVMAVKSRVVLPFMVPQLTNSQPVNSRALAILSSVAGDSLSHHLNKILPAMLHALAQQVGSENEQHEIEYCKSVVLSITDENGVNSVLNELLSVVSGSTSNDNMAYAAVTMLNAFCSNTKFDYSDYVPQLIRSTIFLFTRSDQNLLTAAWECLNSIIKKMDATEMLHHIANVRQAVRFALMDFKEENLPGFCLPKKGIAPVLVIFREGLLNGPPEMKEAAANGLAEVIKCTSAEALKVSVVNMTGPLIRILGDRFSHTVKVSVLETLGLLLAKCGVMLKPFLPQLQTTFIKALHDANRQVRLKAGSCLGKLTRIHVRVDPLFVELHTSIKNETDDTSVRDCMMQALRLCIEGAGGKMSEGTKRQLTPTLIQYLSQADDSARTCGSACLGALAPHLNQDDMTQLFIDQILDGGNVDWTLRHGRAIALQVALSLKPETLMQSWESSIREAIARFLSSDRTPIVISGLKSYGYYCSSVLQESQDLNDDLTRAAVKCIRSDSNDVKIALAQVINFIVSSVEVQDITTTKLWISALVNLTKEKNTLVKTQSELSLIRLLDLDKDQTRSQQKIALLDPGMREAAQDVVNKTLMKILHQAEKITDIDDTLLK